jgi:putative sterol carrier protein
VLDGIFWQMPRHIDRRAAAAVDGTVRWRITGSTGDADVYELELSRDRCRARRGESDAEPRLTIALDAVEFVKLATGNSDPMQAYFKGRIKLAGDIMLAAKLQVLFRIPGRAKSTQPESTVSSSR